MFVNYFDGREPTKRTEAPCFGILLLRCAFFVVSTLCVYREKSNAKQLNGITGLLVTVTVKIICILHTNSVFKTTKFRNFSKNIYFVENFLEGTVPKFNYNNR